MRCLVLFLIITNLLFAQPIKLDSKVIEVTVFTDRAMITRSVETELKKGVNEFAFTDLTSNLNDQSVRISAEGDEVLKILDVKVENRFTTEIQKDEIKKLQEQIDELRNKIQIVSDQISIYNSKKEFIESLKAESVKNSNQKILLDSGVSKEWNDMLQFIDKNLSEVFSGLRVESIKKKQYENEIAALQKTIEQNKSGTSKNYKEIVVKVEAKKTSKATIKPSYIVNSANWYPVYDARVTLEEKSMELQYFAMINQSTGEDWDGVTLTISTVDPVSVKSLPQLNPWYLNITPPQDISGYLPVREVDKVTSLQSGVVPVDNQTLYIRGGRGDEVLYYVDLPENQIEPYSTVSTKNISTTFELKTQNTVPSDNTPHKVTIAISKLPVEFEYTTIPKINEKVYLKGKAVNENDYPLLAGEINVFVDNDFVNRTGLNTVVSTDSMELALGVDESIQVERKLMNKFSETSGLFGGTNKITYEYEIQLKNNRTTEETISVFDQIPVSMNEKISVELIEPKKEDNILKANNQLEWQIKLSAGEQKSILFKYIVEYSSGVNVYGLE